MSSEQVQQALNEAASNAVRRMKVPLTKIIPDPANPRADLDVGELAESLKAVGQQVDLILYQALEDYIPIDGHRRVAAGKLAEMSEMTALVYPAKPSDQEIATARLVTGVTAKNLNPMEVSDQIERMLKAEMSLKNIAAMVGKSAAWVSQKGKMQRAAAELKDKLRKGEITEDRVLAAIAHSDDHAKQIKFAAGVKSRDEARAKNKGVIDTVKANSAVFHMPSCQVSVKGREKLGLNDVIEMLEETARILKRGRSDGWDLTSAVRLMKNRLKARA